MSILFVRHKLIPSAPILHLVSAFIRFIFYWSLLQKLLKTQEPHLLVLSRTVRAQGVSEALFFPFLSYFLLLPPLRIPPSPPYKKAALNAALLIFFITLQTELCIPHLFPGSPLSRQYTAGICPRVCLRRDCLSRSRIRIPIRRSSTATGV